MGRPGELKRPVLSPGPLKELNDALHELHLDAGLPTLSVMYRELGKRISRSSLHDALTGMARPPWDTVEALVEILGTRSPRTSAEREIDRFHQLWVNAARSVIAADPAASSHSDGAGVGGDVQDVNGSVEAADHGLPTSPATTSTPFWIIATDVAAFSKAPDPEQVKLRLRLYNDLGEATDFAGLKSIAQFLDRGDGVLVLVPAEQSTLGSLLGFLLHLQRLMVDQRLWETKLRLRVTVSQGMLTVSDEYGWHGADLNTALRLLDADPLRRITSDPAVHLAVAVSQQIADGLGELKPRGFRPQFHHTYVPSKHGTFSAWIYTSAESV
ncbi:hypothetical protein [Streptomyces sp. NPDC091217]|uniref:hypothetical protein n=1 Tax=Streptomyces sp. NPDC091217 TaxID=3365975 RepID=UPI00381B19C7